MTLLLKKQGICVKKEELLRKTFLIYNSEIQGSELYGEKRSEKIKKKKKLDEKIKKLRDDFKKIDLHNLFRSVHELEGKPKKRLLVVKNQKKVESAKQNKFLKCGKNILNNISMQSFLIIKYLGIHS